MAQLVSINVCCRCVPARHALVCSRNDGVLQTPTFLSQVKTPMRCSKTTPSLFVSVGCFRDALQPPPTDSNPIAHRVRRKRQRLSSNDPIETAPTTRLCTHTLLLSGQS